MGIEMGRISGPLLSENLLRNGEDLAFDTDLLYLDVNDRKIGIKNSTPTNELSVDEIQTTYSIIDNRADIANFSILTNRFQNFIGSIYVTPEQSTNPTIAVPALTTDNFKFSNQKIENITDDSNIEITANGTGTVKFTSSLVNVNGSLHATGDIIWDGNVTLGDSNNDSLTFNTDVTSSIIPNSTTHGLGSLSKYWKTLYSVNVKSTDITASTNININNINLLLIPGKTLYVSINGNDLNTGTHEHSTYRTIKTALAHAVSGDEVVIFPGTYIEIFPLTIPQGVSLRGSSIRSVIIKPTVETNSNDAFLLNGDTTVSLLTIQDYFYNTINNTGYGFRFANNFKSYSRSPYIFNVTIITKGSTTSIEDPYGFNQGDAGAGAIVEYSKADPASPIIPTMLFFAFTTITPNQNSITASGAVRVEWLNSFTYYAKRGIYAVNGANIRSINSANIYGTYGVVADNPTTIVNLTGHNFSYIGTDSNSSNDNSAVIQENEIVAINGAKITYESMDQAGDFRIGDIFYVNQTTGQVSFNAQHIGFDATSSLVFESQYGITNVNLSGVQSGNIRIHNNSIDSLVGPVNLLAASNSTYLNTNVNVTGLLNVTGNASVKGNVFLGNDVLDTLTIVPRLSQTIKPNSNNTFTLGFSNEIWNNAFLTRVNVDNIIQISNNTVSTLSTNTDLKLISSGTGKIQITSTDLEVSNNLTVAGLLTNNRNSSFKNTQINGTLTLIGDLNQTGSIGLTGTLSNNNNINLTSGTSYVRSNGVKLLNNQIFTTTTDSDLQLYGNGIGGVLFDNKIKFTNEIISNRWTSATTNLQKSIIISPIGTGNVVVNSTKQLSLPVTNSVLTTTGEIRYNSDYNSYQGFSQTGLISFANLYDAAGTTYITPELTIGNNDKTLRFGINGSVVATITSSALTSNSIQVDNLHFFDNTVNNIVVDDDFLISQNGTGSVNLNNLVFKPNKIQLQTDQILSFNSTDDGYYKFSGTYGVRFPSGDISQRPLSPELGETRYNTESQLLETFNGTVWDSSIGGGSFATPDEIEDIVNTWAIILG